jgi:hypothetical protein
MRFFLIASIALCSLTAIAQQHRPRPLPQPQERFKYVLEISQDASTLCYRADQDGIPFGSPVDNSYCAAGYKLAKAQNGATYCYMIDAKGRAFGGPVEDDLCLGRGHRPNGNSTF